MTSISRRSRAHCVRGTHEVLRTALTLRNSSRGAEYVFPSSLPGLRTMTTPRKLVQCDIWLLAWKRHQGDLEPQACGFPVCVRRGSLWRTEASGSCLLPLHSSTIGPGFTALSSQRSKKGRQGWFFLCLPQMASACVDKDSIINVCCGGSSCPESVIHCSQQTLSLPAAATRRALPALPLSPLYHASISAYYRHLLLSQTASLPPESAVGLK